ETVLAPVVRDTMHEHGRPYDTVVTFGCVGSNHAVATAAWAQKLGLHCILMLKPQPSSKTVRRNLLLMQHYGAQIHYYPNEEKRTQAMLELFQRYYQEHGVFPYVLPTGAALPLSCVGYVNAAFELKEQIEQGLLPQPDVIYLPVGGTFSAGVSCCTTAGLVVGLAAAGLPTKVVAVATQPENPAAYKKAIIAMMHEVNTLLHTADKNFPLLDHPEQQLDIVYDCAGKSYGLFTQAGKDAIQLLQQADGIMLDGTYSGKAFAALIRDARAGKLQEKKVLFWNTFCGSDFTPQVDYDDYKKLPAGLHVYFEKPTQPLDS
ncbi:MAG TPA: pyridoxal-phosphate dependent enzyme, partial [Candidatus Limnocylindria bacterium]|nr:pyridoxal-phosphate dependent enzyme [Candidatus Limnocylindria bacterium]